MLIAMMVITAFVVVLCWLFFRRDPNGFNRKGIHKNGSEYDDFGYNAHGYDQDGYDQLGYNAAGYDRNGYNRKGYNKLGRNRNGQYNRWFDMQGYETSGHNLDGFLNPNGYPVIVTTHAKERILERMPNRTVKNMQQLAEDAYCFGKSKRQIKRSSAVIVEEIENRYQDGIVLIYQGFIYIFSEENKLITVYKNDRISL